MSDEYDGNIDIGDSIEEISFETEIAETSLDVDSLLDAGADDFAQFETPVGIDEATNQTHEILEVDESVNQILEVPEVDEPVSQILETPEVETLPVEDMAEQLEVTEEIEGDSTEDLWEVDDIMDACEDDFEQFVIADDPVEVPVEEVVVADELAEMSIETEPENTEVLKISEPTNDDLIADKVHMANELGDIQAEMDSDVSAEQVLETSEVEEIPDVENIKEWLGDINPNYVAGELDSPYHVNCGSCALATLKKFEGDDTAIASTETLSMEEMNAGTGMEQVEMTPEAMETYMLEQGAGKMYVVGFDRAPDEYGVPMDGHWFNAYNDNGKIVAIDSQNSSVHDWPPPSPPYNGVTWDISVRKEKA